MLHGLISQTHDTHVWPSAFVLGAYLLVNPAIVQNKRIIEVGCGTGLPGLLAGHLRAREVFLTDSPESAALKSLLPLALNSNNLHHNCIPKSLSWGTFREEDIVSGAAGGTGNHASGLGWLSQPFDLILGADVFYNPVDFEPLLSTISYILRHSPPTTRFITAYHQRSSTRSIQHLLDKWKLKCNLIPRSTYEVVVENATVDGKKVVDDGSGAFENVSSVILLEIAIA